MLRSVSTEGKPWLALETKVRPSLALAVSTLPGAAASGAVLRYTSLSTEEAFTSLSSKKAFFCFGNVVAVVRAPTYLRAHMSC